MEIDRQEFQYWMKRIMERFDILSTSLHNSNRNLHGLDGDELLDNQDVLQYLKISIRTLHRYRKTGKLPHYKISGKLYYRLSDVQAFIRDSFKYPNKTSDD